MLESFLVAVIILIVIFVIVVGFVWIVAEVLEMLKPVTMEEPPPDREVIHPYSKPQFYDQYKDA